MPAAVAIVAKAAHQRGRPRVRRSSAKASIDGTTSDEAKLIEKP